MKKAISIQQEVDEVSNLLRNSLRLLYERDFELLNSLHTNFTEKKYTDKADELIIYTGLSYIKKIHEIALNHRMAFYLETLLCKSMEFNKYSVDIENNRNFGNCKEIEGECFIPDILIHKRLERPDKIDNCVFTPNYLIIEAKKLARERDIVFKNSDINDIVKVNKFISSSDFNFKFGSVITYSDSPLSLNCVLFFKIKETICYEIVTI
ncbi:MAG: hypothetical protein SFY32_06945 [Bacteroidota bacterium]|nr:hypothetical protein [Bacteroidota bacterium]